MNEWLWEQVQLNAVSGGVFQNAAVFRSTKTGVLLVFQVDRSGVLQLYVENSMTSYEASSVQRAWCSPEFVHMKIDQQDWPNSAILGFISLLEVWGVA